MEVDIEIQRAADSWAAGQRRASRNTQYQGRMVCISAVRLCIPVEQ